MSLNWEFKKRIYLLIIYIVGFSITLYAFGKINENNFILIIFWVIIAIFFEINPIVLYDEGQFTLSFAIHLALLIIYGSWFAIVVAALVTTIFDGFRRAKLIKISFNVSQFTITLFLTGLVFNSLKESVGILALPEDLIAFACASIIYTFTNTLLVSYIIALSQRRNVLYVLKLDLKIIILFFAALAPMSMLMVILYKEQPLTMLFIVPPLALAHTSLRNYMSLRLETRKTLGVLADMIDRRDPYTAEHSKRVAEYCVAIAEELCIDDFEIEEVRSAGSLHDLGKIAITDSILLKPGRLTCEEMSIMQSHTEVAYNILKPLNMYKNEAIIVKAHHERYDGKGYPAGLYGNKIPLGARIMAVADSYDAMTTDRPYRKAMSVQAASNELKKNSGTQYDPKVVDAFIAVLMRSSNHLEVS